MVLHQRLRVPLMLCTEVDAEVVTERNLREFVETGGGRGKQTNISTWLYLTAR